jgi:hypothetical protein
MPRRNEEATDTMTSPGQPLLKVRRKMARCPKRHILFGTIDEHCSTDANYFFLARLLLVLLQSAALLHSGSRVYRSPSGMPVRGEAQVVAKTASQQTQVLLLRGHPTVQNLFALRAGSCFLLGSGRPEVRRITTASSLSMSCIRPPIFIVIATIGDVGFDRQRSCSGACERDIGVCGRGEGAPVKYG